MLMTAPQWLKNGAGEDVYVYLSRVLGAIPNVDVLVWTFRPMPDPYQGFEANGVAAAAVEAWARQGRTISTERALRAPRSTQVVWGVLAGSRRGSTERTITIEAIDTTTYRIDADTETIEAIASVIGW
jgi:hypothetical protein